MKNYLYNPETGVYLGEYDADGEPVTCDSLVVSPKTTTIAPPEGGRGHVMVFDVVAQCWEVHSHWEQQNPPPTNLAKPPRSEIHYYSGSFLVFVGVLLWFAALCDDNNGIGIMCGISLILGSSAYMSLRERIQDPTQNTILRKCLEVSAIFLIVLGYLLELFTHKINNSTIFVNSVTPMASIILYFYCLISYKNNSNVNIFRNNTINNILS